MKSVAYKFQVVSLFVLLSAGIFAQNKASAVSENDWIRLQSPSRDLSLCLPTSNYLVDNEDGVYRLYYYKSDIRVSISMENKDNAKDNLRMQRRFIKNKEKYQFFESGDFLINKYDGDDDSKDSSYIWLYLASSKGLYSISVYVKDATNDNFAAIVQSIQLNDKPLFVGKGEPLATRQDILINLLKTDSIILSALSKPDSRQPKLEKALDQEKESDKDKPVYSRDLIILRKPRAAYTDNARYNMINGTVKFRITFMSNGELGQINLVSAVDKGLAHNAFKAARKMKFLPAEVDGKPVEASRIVEYAFSIY